MKRSTAAAARRLANGPWGRRFVRHLAVECDENLARAAAALEAALARLLPRVAEPGRLFQRLTAAWMGDGTPASNAAERRARESKAIRAFAKRVCDRPESQLIDALTGELSAHL